MKTLLKIHWQHLMVLIFCVIFVASPIDHSYAQTVTIFVDNVPLQTDTPAQIFQNRTMVPIAAIASAFSAKVSWDEDRKVVIIDEKDTYIELSTRENLAIVNGRITNMDVPATIINGRTMVPIFFVANYMGLSIAWDQANYTAYITHPAFVAPMVPSQVTDPASIPASDPPSVPTDDTQDQASRPVVNPDTELTPQSSVQP